MWSKLSPSASRPRKPPSVTLQLDSHALSRPSPPDRLRPPSPRPSLSHGRYLIAPRVTAQELGMLNGPGASSRTSIDPYPVFTSNGASPSDQTTASTTPLRPSCPGSPRRSLDEGGTAVSRPWEDAPRANEDGSKGEKFQRNVYFIGEDLGKIPMRMSIDTQSRFSVIARDKAEKLALAMKKCEEMICPLTIGSQKNEAPVEGMVEADWHFFNGEETYTTTFRVVDMTDFDVLLGRDDIAELGLVRLSKAVPYQEGVVRRPGR